MLQINVGQDSEAMIYGRENLMSECHTPERWKEFDECIVLFAYANPADSPSGYLLGAAHRSELAATLIRTLRSALGKREVSTLEDIFRQSCVVHSSLKAAKDGAVCLIDTKKFVDDSR